jgi:hypothetical protein
MAPIVKQLNHYFKKKVPIFLKTWELTARFTRGTENAEIVVSR